MALLEVRGLGRSFYGVRALDGADLDVVAGRITGLIGPNGAGKTTLFNCITGVIPPDRGSVTFDGADITGLRPDQITGRGLVLLVEDEDPVRSFAARALRLRGYTVV